MTISSIVDPDTITSENEASPLQLFKTRFLGWKEEFSKLVLTSYTPNTLGKKVDDKCFKCL